MHVCQASPTAHMAITAGRDGSVRVFDYAARKLLHTLAFNRPATVFAPVGTAGHAVLVGFKDGVLRSVLRCAT